MNDSNNILDNPELLAAPRIEQAGPLLIAGLREPLDQDFQRKIPQLWQRLVACWDQIPHRSGPQDYGICIHLRADEYCYMAGCGVADFTGLPDTFSAFIIPSQTYAIFPHQGHIQHICKTLDFIMDTWLPQSAYRHGAEDENSLHFLERYGEQFDPEKGEGDVEIWVPVKPRA